MNIMKRIYKYDGIKGWSIDYGEDIQMPQTLFKYYALSDNSVDALTNLYVYATHPNQLNDPFDCDADLIAMDEEKDIRILLSDSAIFDSFLNMCGGDIEALKSISPKLFKAIMYRKCGIFSLCSSVDNKHMWSIYANNNGFCIEFDYHLFPFKYSGPFFMNYVNSLESKATSQLGVPGAALYQTNTKTSDWSNEKEWRLMIHNPEGSDMRSYGEGIYCCNFGDEHDRKFRYPINAIKCLYLGINFMGEQCIEISQDQEWEVSFSKDTYQGKILDFLTRTLLPTKLARKTGLDKLEFIPIQVIHLNTQVYRIVRCDTDLCSQSECRIAF